ncbi:MAG: mechanosensitive ion channel family protein [Thermoproteota archaeon]|nr:mechanosensitive ion channel family protein [Thermoproteota archaeon]
MKEEDESRKNAVGQSKKGRVSPRNNIIKRIVVLAIILSVTLTASTFILNSKLPHQELMYIQAAEVAIIGYFVLETISAISYKLALPDRSLETAKAIRSFVRITGTIIIVATIISYLAQNPIVAASISTISALVIGFASQNILANMISGLYLSLVRPFKIGDKITISSNSGIIYDIELVYVRLMTENGDIVLVPSSSMVSGTVIVNKS